MAVVTDGERLAGTSSFEFSKVLKAMRQLASDLTGEHGAEKCLRESWLRLTLYNGECTTTISLARAGDEDIDQSPCTLLPVGAVRYVGYADTRPK
jgi:hypothetical protein